MRALSRPGFGVLLLAAASANAQYSRHDLVSDQAGKADVLDSHLQNAWGIAFSATSPAWVADGGTGLSTIYNGHGAIQGLVVNIPGQGGGAGEPTGVRFYGGSSFLLNPFDSASSARFIFAGEDGIISAWRSGTSAQIVVNNGTGAVYKGLAVNAAAGSERIYAANFHAGTVDTFNGTFGAVSASFTDPNLPAGYAPFNAQVFGSSVYVTYALQDAGGMDDVPGAGHGIVDVFGTDGTLQKRLITGGLLNSPWGMAIAPADFGTLGGALLVGNFGDGHINAYDPGTGAPLGTLMDGTNTPIVIDGLWGIEFGNGSNGQPTNTLFFAAGPEGKAHGLYGRLDVPGPGVGAAMVVGVLGAVRRRRAR